MKTRVEWVVEETGRLRRETGQAPIAHPSRIRCRRCQEKHYWLWQWDKHRYCKECFLQIQGVLGTYGTCG